MGVETSPLSVEDFTESITEQENSDRVAEFHAFVQQNYDVMVESERLPGYEAPFGILMSLCAAEITEDNVELFFTEAQAMIASARSKIEREADDKEEDGEKEEDNVFQLEDDKNKSKKEDSMESGEKNINRENEDEFSVSANKADNESSERVNDTSDLDTPAPATKEGPMGEKARPTSPTVAQAKKHDKQVTATPAEHAPAIQSTMSSSGLAEQQQTYDAQKSAPSHTPKIRADITAHSETRGITKTIDRIPENIRNEDTNSAQDNYQAETIVVYESQKKEGKIEVAVDTPQELEHQTITTGKPDTRAAVGWDRFDEIEDSFLTAAEKTTQAEDIDAELADAPIPLDTGEAAESVSEEEATDVHTVIDTMFQRLAEYEAHNNPPATVAVEQQAQANVNKLEDERAESNYLPLALPDVENGIKQIAMRINELKQEESKAIYEILDEISAYTTYPKTGLETEGFRDSETAVDTPPADTEEERIPENISIARLKILLDKVFKNLKITPADGLSESLLKIIVTTSPDITARGPITEDQKDINTAQGAGTHELIKHFLVGVSKMKQSLNRASFIGRSAIRLVIDAVPQ